MIGYILKILPRLCYYIEDCHVVNDVTSLSQLPHVHWYSSDQKQETARIWSLAPTSIAKVAFYPYFSVETHCLNVIMSIRIKHKPRSKRLFQENPWLFLFTHQYGVSGPLLLFNHVIYQYNDFPLRSLAFYDESFWLMAKIPICYKFALSRTRGYWSIF